MGILFTKNFKRDKGWELILGGTRKREKKRKQKRWRMREPGVRYGEVRKDEKKSETEAGYKK
mgnify:CR=1 FL=1